MNWTEPSKHVLSGGVAAQGARLVRTHNVAGISAIASVFFASTSTGQILARPLKGKHILCLLNSAGEHIPIWNQKRTRIHRDSIRAHIKPGWSY